MTKVESLAAMQQLVDLKYRQQQESFARLIAQENTLRASLGQLDAKLEQSRRNTDAQQSAIGADILWNAWVGRKKRELNMKLAQVLAVKEQHIAQVRKAYGKVIVTEALFKAAVKEASQKRALSQLERAITSMMP